MTFSEIYLIMMLTKICVRIMKMRERYGARRSKVIKMMTAWSGLRGRRERQRTIRMTSRRMMTTRLNGRLRQGDREDVERLNKEVEKSKGDFEVSLRCLAEATYYVDDLCFNPRLIKDLKYVVWSRALDCFISEMRRLVECKRPPGKLDLDIVDHLIWRLSQMRINETIDEQVEVRLNLEDAIRSLFTLKISQKRRLRMTGC